MTLPRELKLEKTADGHRLVQAPVGQLETLRGAHVIDAENRAFDAVDVAFPGGLLELELEFDLKRSTATALGVALRNDAGDEYRVYFDKTANRLVSDRTQSGNTAFAPAFAPVVHTAPRLSGSAELEMHLFVDHSSVEVFFDDGRTVMTELIFPRKPFTTATLFGENGTAFIDEAEGWLLQSAW
jgi:fructan beta-fructosidase